LNQVKNAATAYEKQTTLQKEDTEKFVYLIKRNLQFVMFVFFNK
jgi:predicted AAA+ superfamily ATPase